jgi:fibro-slime domain-containing protein
MPTPAVLRTTALSIALGAAAASAAEPPASFTLPGVVRDFKERSAPGGHPDFEQMPDRGFGLYCRNVEEVLVDGKPKWQGGGRMLLSQFRDSSGQFNISWNMAGAGDLAGTWGRPSSGGVTSASTFDQWFRDLPEVNLSSTLAIELTRQEDGTYVFDSAATEPYSSIGGFFPINDQLFGNSSPSDDRNYHFTFEIVAEFAYDADAGQVFTFTGDDDVFVFINDRLVIDLGGVHGVTSQSVLLDRLGLEDGQSYRLNFFFAERHRTQSNFRIQTNLELQSAGRPTISAAYD